MGKNKYIDIKDYVDPSFPFTLFLGGRGIGKSYSGLSLIEEDKILWMRRTDGELEALNDNPKSGEGLNPYKAYNRNNKTNYGFKEIKKHISGIYERYYDEDDKLQYGKLRGYGAALTTLASVRGIDLSDVKYMEYDEYIPEKHVRKINGEGAALFNCYETVNRNRELEGEPPVIFFGFANAFDISCPLFQELGVVAELEKCLRKGKKIYEDRERGLRIIMLEATEQFKQEKKETALYRLTKGTAYYDMALSNDFAYNDFSLIQYRNLKGWKPVFSVDEKAYVYRQGGRIHVSYMSSKCPDYGTDTRQGKEKLQRDFSSIFRDLFVEGLITYESYELKIKVNSILLS